MSGHSRWAKVKHFKGGIDAKRSKIFAKLSKEITIAVNSTDEFFVKAPSDKNGVYLYAFDTSPLELGTHSAKSKAAISNEISAFGNAANFLVGNKNVAAVATVKKFLKGDLNSDNRVSDEPRSSCKSCAMRARSRASTRSWSARCNWR